MTKSALPYLAAIIAIIVWGATPAATHIAVSDIDAATVGMLRTVLAAAILLPIASLLRLPLPKDRQGWVALIVSAIAGFVGYTLLFTIGIKRTSTSHAALILAAAPVFTGVIGFFIERRWPKWLWWAGALIAMLGEAVLIGMKPAATVQGPASVQGDLWVLAGVIFSSAGYVAGGFLSAKIGTRAATAWGIGIAGLILLPVVANRFDATLVHSQSAHSWAAVGYLALFTSIIGYAAWYWALGKAGVARIAPIQFAQPIVSVLLAIVLFNEPVTLPVVISLVTILSGVLFSKMAAGGKS